MIMLSESSEDEMVALFLQTEIHSVRWREHITALLELDRQPLTVVEQPDLTSLAENTYRARLLGSFRGYRQGRGLFEHFPADIRWQHVALNTEEARSVRYIDYDYWNELSRGSRLACDAADTIRAGTRIFNVPNDGFLALAEALRQGAQLPELILVQAGEGSPLVVLEGHVRLTAYALAPECLATGLRVLLGTSPGFSSWE